MGYKCFLSKDSRLGTYLISGQSINLCDIFPQEKQFPLKYSSSLWNISLSLTEQNNS